jgi:hypothetical protein
MLVECGRTCPLIKEAGGVHSHCTRHVHAGYSRNQESLPGHPVRIQNTTPCTTVYDGDMNDAKGPKVMQLLPFFFPILFDLALGYRSVNLATKTVSSEFPTCI